MRLEALSARHKKVRRRVKGSRAQPRLCVYRSNRHIYGVLIDDEAGKVLTSVSTLSPQVRSRLDGVSGKLEPARLVGEALAQKARELKVDTVVFDRGGYRYQGRVRALAEGAREGGLKL
jgi:large subunit ribosomal protein L18